MSFEEYMKTLGCEKDQIIGQIPRDSVQLIRFAPKDIRSDKYDFIIMDPGITHIAVYKGQELGFINQELPMPEWWVVRNFEDDPPGYTVYAYAPHIPEISLALELPDDEQVVREFLKP